jgi:hypothetical protein
MIGLIVKGTTSLFLEGPDPSPEAAVGLVNRVRMGKIRSVQTKLSALHLNHTARPRPLARHDLAWAYVFVTLTEADDRRLEPGPFDDELARVVAAIEAEQHPEAKPA